MAQEINLGGTIYISSKRAAEIMGYSQDYVGQLARSGAIEAKRVSGLWYVTEDSIRKHKEKADEYIPTPPPYTNPAESEVAVSFDGRDYVSAGRASKLTGYTQDYVGQLARSGQVLSRQIGNRWYVDRESLLQHKKEKDALLAAVQMEAVGLKSSDPGLENNLVQQDHPVSIEYTSTHFTYVAEDASAIPSIAEKSPDEEPLPASAPENAAIMYEEASESDEINEIPIRVIAPQAPTKEEYTSYAAPVRSDGKKRTRAMTFFISGLTVFAALGTLAYVGDAMGYLDVSRMLPGGNQQEAAADASVLAQSNPVARFFGDLLSKDLVYHRH